jgi:diguanylate cyclase (GGDEF)-like protein/PAS domain S-box-containing protein
VTLKRHLAQYSKNFWQTLAMIVLFCAVVIAYMQSENQVDQAHEVRIQSHWLADELRQSSDDLTSAVRTYVVTGDPVYKQYYQDILDIREGKKLRSHREYEIDWRPVASAELRAQRAGKKIALLTLMRQVGFTEAEFAKLATAKSKSDALTATEFVAIDVLESTRPITAEHRAQASEMLHDAAYQQAKSVIMQSISDFYQMMDQRTQAAVHYHEQVALILRIAVILLGMLLAYAVLHAYRAMYSTLGGSVHTLYRHIAKIGRGDFSAEITVDSGMENSVIGWLAATRIKLLQMDAERDQAEAKVHRQTQLYAALSHCNQAIVRCHAEADLFPKICRDVVTFGAMKMAWIAMFDDSRQQLIPVAAFGTAADYLEQLHFPLTADATHGLSLSAMAFTENAAVWCLDFKHDPATARWRELDISLEWQAAAALPLHRNGQVIGTFNLYADDAHAFDEAGRGLLLEMAVDLDYAIDHFKIETERELLKDKLVENEESARLVLENSLDAIVNMDSAGLVLEWSGSAERMFGFARSAALGQVLGELIVPKADRAAHEAGMQRVLSGKPSKMMGKRIEVNALHADGFEFPVEMSIAQISRGDEVIFSAFIRDISERRASESRIQQLAHFDTLTGLPNRSMLQDHFNYALSLAKRNSGKLAVIFLDLDHFKDINDTLGHSVGDILLIELARRLQLALREEDTLSRLGGDEFILILPGTDAHGAAIVAQKLLSVMAEVYHIESYELTVTGSIGIALYPNDGADLELLSQKADTAMYRAKQEGRNDYRFFTAAMQASSARNLQLMTALRHALERNQLSLHYQPQLSLHDQRIVGAEALLRWQHPELGPISPAEFIPVAEDSGMILPIGEWVLRQAAQQAKLWMDAGYDPLIMAVNLSAIQFRHPDLPDMVTRVLNEVGLAPEYLELELTEGVAMYDPLAAIAMMNKLHDLGIRMSIDDFGTGYSSLSYLKKFKVYKLKIDQSFVRDISTDPEDKAIVSAVISMARSLGLQTIAEGVETIEQMTYLREQGCDEVQGYFYSRPLPAAELEQYLKAHGHQLF